MRGDILKKQILRCLALLLLVLTMGNLLPQTPGGTFSTRAARSLGGPVEVQAVTASGGKWKKKGGKIYYYPESVKFMIFYNQLAYCKLV